MTVIWVDKVKAPIGLKCDKRPIGLWMPNISELNSPRNRCGQPRQHLHIKAIWTRLPPELVNIRTYKPVEGTSGGSTEKYNRCRYCTLENHIHIRRCHEGYDWAQWYGQAAGWQRKKLYFLNGGRDWAMISNCSVFFICPSLWSDTNLVVISFIGGLRCPSFLGSSSLNGRGEVVFGTWAKWPCSRPTRIITWSRTEKLLLIMIITKTDANSMHFWTPSN